ncbi:DUF1552 domain-containing protein [Blastopirellula marina]|uniref:Secreted protein containing DUF1552 n=1 Tax=Blastopirellula marina DSM 3645 TaxID=314230 RepID=A3ZPH0_9BACT|nr:DUF1552 domain-containing protein [Blastopirellula marina]EAQ81648.1 hypothetical protein DSM3645_28742 [Blastopirellula marina DSM 3645]
MPKSISRRTALRGLGVCLSLPLLDAMNPRSLAAPSQFSPLAKTNARQPRMICCYVPNGVNILEWSPESAGADYKLSPTLATLADHRDDFTVFSNMGHPHSQGGHSGADTWLTGADLTATPGSDYTNWVSADQIVAERHSKETRFGSLQLSDSSGTGSAGHSHTLSFDRRGTPIPAENSPKRLFERLFVPDNAGDRAATLRRYAEQKSILDSVLAEARSLHKKLGKKDQQKLDQYLGSVRETEQRVERLEAWIDVPKPELDAKFLQLNSKSHDAHDRPMWIDVMLELSYLSFVTDTTRVITFEWSREAGGYGGGGENHHELSHHGGDAGMLKKLGVIDRFHLSRLARFLDFLKQTDDGDGNMLDHTMVLYGSGMNSGKGGEHSPKNLPLLLAGGNSLGLKHGKHLAYDENSHPPLSNLLLTMIQKMGVETDQFSDATGTLIS